MHNYNSVQRICEELWDFEDQNNLFNLQIKEIYIWKLIRFYVFRKLTNLRVGYNQAHTTSNDNTDKIKALGGLLYNSFKRNPLKKEYNIDQLIFDHKRKLKVDGQYIDIYTDFFKKNVKESSYEVIEEPYLLKHLTKPTSSIKFTDHMILVNFFKKTLNPIRLSAIEECAIKQLEKKVSDHFSFNIELTKVIYNNLNNFYYQYRYYSKLLKKRNPRRIYLVVSYSKDALIAAAKDLNIEVVEFQHGVITDYHFAYNFADPDEYVPYFPDKILTFGEYWAKTKRFPKQTEVEVYGFPYLEQQLEQYKNVKKKEKQVLFLSQGTIGKELSKFAKDLAEQMPDYHFFYKLHPGEYDRWKNDYPELLEAQKLSNFKVIDNNGVNLYQWFAESEFQVGVYSTAIFEGLTLGCKTVLVDLPGIEYVQDLVDEKFVLKANIVSDLKYKIENHQVESFDKNYFFKTNN